MFKKTPIILILLTNKNVALIYSVTICEKKTKDCALLWINCSTLFLFLIVVAFHNKSPPLTMAVQMVYY